MVAVNVHIWFHWFQKMLLLILQLPNVDVDLTGHWRNDCIAGWVIKVLLVQVVVVNVIVGLEVDDRVLAGSFAEPEELGRQRSAAFLLWFG